jgi:hypothetical protein
VPLPSIQVDEGRVALISNSRVDVLFKCVNKTVSNVDLIFNYSVGRFCIEKKYCSLFLLQVSVDH